MKWLDNEIINLWCNCVILLCRDKKADGSLDIVQHRAFVKSQGQKSVYQCQSRRQEEAELCPRHDLAVRATARIIISFSLPNQSFASVRIFCGYKYCFFIAVSPCAANTCDIPGDQFVKLFLASSVCRRMENGEPAYIAGKEFGGQSAFHSNVRATQ